MWIVGLLLLASQGMAKLADTEVSIEAAFQAITPFIPIFTGRNGETSPGVFCATAGNYPQTAPISATPGKDVLRRVNTRNVSMANNVELLGANSVILRTGGNS
ncbi:hypothetical protein DMENIID0001_087850 [Sergentomyia squamirostris]